MLTHRTTIEGEDWTFYRANADAPYAEVKAQRGAFDAARRPDAWINTQYAAINTDLGRIENQALLAAAREYQALRLAAAPAPAAASFESASPRSGDPATTWMGQTSMDDKDSIF